MKIHSVSKPIREEGKNMRMQFIAARILKFSEENNKIMRGNIPSVEVVGYSWVYRMEGREIPLPLC